MTRRILVPMDGSDQSRNALEYAVEEYPDETIVLLHVIDPIDAGFSAGASMPGHSEEWYERSVEEAEELFEQAREWVEDAGAGVALETATETGRPSRAIVEFVEEEGVDHVVMGSHGRSGVSRILLGSVAETVVRRSPVPVTIVR